MTIYHDWWKDTEVQEVEFLDSLSDDEILSVYNSGDKIDDMFDNINYQFSGEYVKLHPEESELFNSLSVEEFQEYLETRFDCKFILISYYELTDIKKKVSEDNKC